MAVEVAMRAEAQSSAAQQGAPVSRQVRRLQVRVCLLRQRLLFGGGDKVYAALWQWRCCQSSSFQDSHTARALPSCLLYRYAVFHDAVVICLQRGDASRREVRSLLSSILPLARLRGASPCRHLLILPR